MPGMTFPDLLYKLAAYVYNNKQSMLGGLTAALAFIQASDKLKNLMPVNTYEWLMLGVGLLMVLFARSASGGAVSSVMPKSLPADRPPPQLPAEPPEAG